MELDMVHNIAWKFFYRNPHLNYEDLFAEAALAYCEAQNRFDPSRGAKETTLAYTYMKNALIAYIDRANAEYGHRDVTLVEIAVPFHHPISEVLQEMSTEAQEICQMVLSAPEEYAGFCAKECRGRIYRKLRKRGWTWAKIWKGFDEVKQVLNENCNPAII